MSTATIVTKFKPAGEAHRDDQQDGVILACLCDS